MVPLRHGHQGRNRNTVAGPGDLGGLIRMKLVLRQLHTGVGKQDLRSWKYALKRESENQAERRISTAKLNTLLRLHPQPINVVVFHAPSG